jgi:hypothetical protein
MRLCCRHSRVRRRWPWRRWPPLARSWGRQSFPGHWGLCNQEEILLNRLGMVDMLLGTYVCTYIRYIGMCMCKNAFTEALVNSKTFFQLTLINFAGVTWQLPKRDFKKLMVRTWYAIRMTWVHKGGTWLDKKFSSTRRNRFFKSFKKILSARTLRCNSRTGTWIYRQNYWIVNWQKAASWPRDSSAVSKKISLLMVSSMSPQLWFVSQPYGHLLCT